MSTSILSRGSCNHALVSDQDICQHLLKLSNTKCSTETLLESREIAPGKLNRGGAEQELRFFLGCGNSAVGRFVLHCHLG